MTQADKVQERQRLATLINQWNEEHVEIFELSQPNENCEFHGVVRFFFQDGPNVVTKCIRVASSAVTSEVVDVLVEKFRPDMRMLTNDRYILYEVHENGEERRLMPDEKILLAQLNWGEDVREGRFLLKREGAPTISVKKEPPTNFKRKLSKREKKEKKKQEKLRGKENDMNTAEKLYTEMPESKFTRSISNPDSVMRRRRQQKVDKKLQECRGQDGQGGTLKIYGETLRPDVPYKTLLLSTGDNVAKIIKEAMDKYGHSEADPDDFCLVQVMVPPGEREYHGGPMGEEKIMDDHECPLAIAMDFPPSRGSLMFQLKRRPADQKKTKHKKLRAVSHDDLRYNREEPIPQNKLPYLVEQNPDGSDKPNGRVHKLHLKFTEVGSDRSMIIYAQGPNIQARHCVLGLSPDDGIVTITPTSADSETYVNNQRVFETTTLQNGMTVRLGKFNYFRFIDPNFEDRLRKGQVPPDGMARKPGGPYGPNMPKPQETNFDLDGKVETMHNHSPRDGDRPTPEEMQKRHNQPQFSPREPDRTLPPQRQIDEQLPAALEFREDKEEGYLTSVILDNNSGIHFKLAPTYTIYMSVRYCLSNNYRPDMSPGDRAMKVTSFVTRVAKMVLSAIQNNGDNPATLAFWMANASEILHFFKQDHDIHPFSQDAQEMLAESVQMAFHHLVRCLQYDLQRTMPAFLDENDMADDEEAMQNDQRYNQGKPSLTDVLDTLSSAMNLLRRCRVNAALTIQLFSQLFHFINMWLFNFLVTDQRQRFCTRSWGMRLKKRLGRIEAWAEKQGLELAADCHLCRIIQAAHLLQAPKSSQNDIADISSTCFKLNSLQLRELLQRYIPEHNEHPIPQNLIERVVQIAENMADDLTKNEGREVQLEEDPDLQLPFLLPEDGYSCDTARGIPNGLAEFIEPLARAGLCRMVAQPASRGDWTVYMTSDDGQRIDDAVQKGQVAPPQHNAEPHRVKPQLPKEPEVVTVTFNKVKGSMGLSIVAAKGEGQKERGIYIKSVVHGGAAAIDGRLQAGDQLLEVDSKSLVGLTQEKAAELMTRTGQTVSLKVAKQGAFYHGLATLLSQPSPVMQRAASPKKPASPQITKQRPFDEGPPPYNGEAEMDRSRHFPGNRGDQRHMMNTSHSRSSPSLNSDGMGDRAKATSVGNLRGDHHHPQQMGQDRFQQRPDPREQDPRSKSMANLRMDNSFDQRDQQPHHHMKPAASVGTLQNSGGQPYHPEYYNQSLDRRNDPRGHDYENHPYTEQRTQRNQPERGFPDQNMIQGHRGGGGPPSSRTSQSGSFRDERPHSAYFGQPQERQDSREERPRSMEINANKIYEWQQKYGSPEDRPSQGSPHDRSFENRDPSYVNTRSPPHASGYVNQSDIPKMTINNESRQPNFYENTVPRPGEPQPAFHQLQRPQIEVPQHVAIRPNVAPKPATKVTPADIPRVEVDNRQTQSHFFNSRMPEHHSPKSSMTQSAYLPGQTHVAHSQGSSYNDPRTASLGRNQKFPSPGREMYQPHPHQSPELPPPPSDIPPDLPPPPANMDLEEELPPLPPPPTQDYQLEQQIREDPPYANQGEARMNMAPHGYLSYNTQQQIHSQQFADPRMAGHDMGHRMVGYTEPQRHPPPQQQPPAKPQHTIPQPYQPNHDYQNINYDQRSPNRSFESPPQHSPNQNPYEQYERKHNNQGLLHIAPHKATTLPANMSAPHNFNVQENRSRVVGEITDLTNRAGKDIKPVKSPWEREERERQEKEQAKKLLETEITDLESRSYLSPQDSERLRKLRLEAEFQRRLEEAEGKSEEEDDSDLDITARSHAGREIIIKTLHEDLQKAKQRMEDYNRKRMFEDLEREKERMTSLQGRLEIFEREREERAMRNKKREERKRQEHEDYLRKQRELRDKQRAESEEQKRLMIAEEEKLRQRKMEELNKRKEFEQEQRRKIQQQREEEEKQLRAEARRREEEFQRQMQEKRERERKEAEREIRVEEERKRIEHMTNQQQGYQPYANLPSQPQMMYSPNKGVPPPPTRGSSYDVANRNTGGAPQNINNNGYRGMNNPLRNQLPEPSKKSVKFNTQLETQINTYNEDRTPHGSVSSYRSSVSSEQSNPHSPSVHSQGLPENSIRSNTNTNALEPTSPLQNNLGHDIRYRTTENTPVVIGSQEVYRDPRNRITAQKESQKIPQKPQQEKMSFKQKMKFFAQEAGEDTIKYKPKASKTLRNIESQLHNGQ